MGEQFYSGLSRLTAKLSMFAVALVLLCPTAHGEEGGDAILGIWHTTGGTSQVQIFKTNNQYFGKIISLKEPNWPAHSKLGTPGAPKNDRNNPNPELRSRPIIRLQIVRDFDYVGKKTWAHGSVYDPMTGKTYHGKITMTATNRLELRGFVGISLFGRTVVWTR